MVESGMGAEVTGDKGKGKGKEKGGEAMWAVMMVRELWKKSVWNDAKTVSIVALAAFHPNTKVQSAAIHFFLGSDQDDGEPDSSDDETNVGQARKDIKAFQHRLNVGNTSNRKGEKKMRALQKEASRVSRAFQSQERKSELMVRNVKTKRSVLEQSQISQHSNFCTTRRHSARGYTKTSTVMVSPPLSIIMAGKLTV